MTSAAIHRKAALEDALSDLAARQRGVVRRGQLLDLGFTAGEIERRLAEHRLRPLHRAVYGVGPLPVAGSREMAAVLACGRWAVVCHRSAISQWQLLPEEGASSPVHVALRRGNRRGRAGIRIHRLWTLGRDEVTRLQGLPVTTPERSLMDVATAVTGRELEQALARALARGLARRSRVRALMRRHAGHAGIRPLRLLLEGEMGQPAFTRSEGEERLLTLVRRGKLPPPRANVGLHGFEVDFFWPAERLVVEVDGFAFHGSEVPFDADRRRDATFVAAGIRVMRVTWNQLVSEPEAVLVRLTRALFCTGE